MKTTHRMNTDALSLSVFQMREIHKIATNYETAFNMGRVKGSGDFVMFGVSFVIDPAGMRLCNHLISLEPAFLMWHRGAHMTITLDIVDDNHAWELEVYWGEEEFKRPVIHSNLPSLREEVEAFLDSVGAPPAGGEA